MIKKLARMPRWQQIGATAAMGLLLLLFLIWLHRCWSSLVLVLVPFIISIFLAYLLSPLVQFLEQRHISRSFAIAVIYLLFTLIVFVAWVQLVPSLLEELQNLTDDLPGYLQKLHATINRFQDNYQRFNLPPDIRKMLDNNIDGLGDAVLARLDQLYESAFGIIGTTLLLLLVPVLTYYFLRDEKHLKQSLIRLVPRGYRLRFRAMAHDINCSLGAFLRGSLLVSLAVGGLTYISFLIIHLDFPLMMAGIVAITNLIPLAGPVIGALPALLIALLQSPLQSLKVLIIIVAIQQAEAQLIYPAVIGRSIGFHPLAIIFALLFAGKLFGFIGLILVLPSLITIRIFFHHFFKCS